MENDWVHYNDTWEFDGIDWTKVNIADPPNEMWMMSFDYMDNNYRAIRFGGLKSDYFNETWAYSAAQNQ